ncbi:MAG: cysteine desulfurase [Candidatus Aenigmatarchaeota archaeon]
MNASKIREDFPILQSVKPPIYFDNACMSLRPRQVVAAMNEYYEQYPACVGRSQHRLGKLATEAYERARARIAKFIGAKPEEIIFTRNTTEGINLVARAFPFEKGDVVLGTDKEHNSNLLPWLMLAKERGIRHAICHSNSDNTFSMPNFEDELKANRPKLVAFVHASNLDGVTIPAQEIIKRAHDAGALVLLDAAQSAPHQSIDVRKLGVDFLAFSGHKMLGPSGTGVLYVKRAVVEQLGQFMIGGETVINSTYDSYQLDKPPARFEAGLQNYAGAIGLAAAADYLEKIGLENIRKHELELTKQLTAGISQISGVSIIGPAPELRGGVTSFNVGKLDPHAVAIMLDELAGIAVRSGQHCVHSWFNAHDLKGSVRASLYLYNTEEEVRTFIETLQKIAKTLK